MIFRKARPPGNDNLPDLQVEQLTTLIARDTSLEGVLESDGLIEIDGHFRGTLNARSCVIGEAGFVEGSVVAEDITVRGRVAGPLRGLRVRLLSGSEVHGDVHNQSLTMEGGAQLNGAVWQAEDPLAAQQPPQRQSFEPPGAALFGDKLWADRGEDTYRPLAAVKPRR
jgi:cytoskeletal protein CcmA (bactofilin family)